MNKFFRVTFLMLSLCSFTLLTSCDEEDPPLPDNIAEFQADAQGLSADQSEATVTLKVDRAVDVDAAIVVSFVPTGVTYGTDFTTTPAADASNKITIPVAAGETTASFKVTKTNTTGLTGDEKIVFTIETIADGLTLGDQKTFTLSFSEIIATSATMEINGGGTNANNRVFIDLSGNRQTAVARTTWDFAFSSKADEFRVYLNAADKMLARALDKNDLASVTAADTVGFGAQLDLETIFAQLNNEEIPDWVLGATAWMDMPAHPEMTAIAGISSNNDDNHVYIVNRGEGPNHEKLGWVKIRVLRDGENYEFQYADIADENFETVTVTKNSATNLTYFSLATNDVVTVEPNTGDWDIAWTGLTNELPLGPPGAPTVPYYYQDIILQNTTGVSTAMIKTADIPYDSYGEDDIDTDAFVSDNQLNIGDSWRSTREGPVLNTDRYYVIQDGDGNVYKLQFTVFVADGGVRGKPTFKFDLVKKGS